MFRSSLDGIRALLKATFPNVTRIYVNKVPAGFVRPSFFIELASGSDEDLNKAFYNSTATWQIVYFAPINSAGDADAFEQLQTADTLKDKFKDNLTLNAPDGTVYHILECSVEPRDAEVYITVRLEIDKRRPEPQYDLMDDIQFDFKEG